MDDLLESIEEVGLINPLVVDSEGYLLSGGRRYTAVKRLGWETVKVICYDQSEVDAEIMSIDDNLSRRDFKGAQLARMLARRKELYELKHPETKAGVAGAVAANKSMGRGEDANDSLSSASDDDDDDYENAESGGESHRKPVKTFTQDTAEKTGVGNGIMAIIGVKKPAESDGGEDVSAESASTSEERKEKPPSSLI